MLELETNFRKLPIAPDYTEEFKTIQLWCKRLPTTDPEKELMLLFSELCHHISVGDEGDTYHTVTAMIECAHILYTDYSCEDDYFDVVFRNVEASVKSLGVPRHPYPTWVVLIGAILGEWSYELVGVTKSSIRHYLRCLNELGVILVQMYLCLAEDILEKHEQNKGEDCDGWY